MLVLRSCSNLPVLIGSSLAMFRLASRSIGDFSDTALDRLLWRNYALLLGDLALQVPLVSAKDVKACWQNVVPFVL